MKYIKVIDERGNIILVNMKRVKYFLSISENLSSINFKKGDYIAVKVKVDDFGIAVRKFNEGYKGVVVLGEINETLI